MWWKWFTKMLCLWDTLKLYRHRIFCYIFFFLGSLDTYTTHILCAFAMKHERYRNCSIYVKHQDMSIYLGYCIIFIPHYSEFLFLDIVHDRISGFTSCRRKNKYRTPSNQWIPLPYYGCLLYIKKKRNSILTIIYHISFSDYNNMCVLWRATSALLLSILNKNSIFLNRSFSPRFNVLFVFCMSYVKSFHTIRVSIRWFSNRN